MKEYMKISNIFKFDEKYRNIVGINEPFKTLKDIEWIGTEKIDGTNIRIYWDGHRISIHGRTDNAQFQGDLKEYLDSIFLNQEMEYVFEQMFGEKEVYLFGEGYGLKVQTNGDKYTFDGKRNGFILFDVNIDGFDLSKDNVFDIANRLGLEHVPIVFTGKLIDAIKYVSLHNYSTLANHLHEMEGIVLEPKNIILYDNKKNLVKCKCKYNDLVKGNININNLSF